MAGRELGNATAEAAHLRLGAIHNHPKGKGKAEAEHLHKALAVDAVDAIIQVHREGLGSGNVDKFFDISNRAETNQKFFLIFHLTLYKPPFFVYNDS